MHQKQQLHIIHITLMILKQFSKIPFLKSIFSLDEIHLREMVTSFLFEAIRILSLCIVFLKSKIEKMNRFVTSVLDQENQRQKIVHY